MSGKVFHIVIIAVCVALMTGCGLRLKGSNTTSTSGKRIYVTGIPAYNPFTRQLQKTLTLSGGAVVKKPEEADVHLHVINQRKTRRGLSLSQRGKANEYELTFEITFEVYDRDRHQLMPKQTISMARDYFNQQLRVLGKANEEETIWREVYKSVVNNFLQRLDIALKRPVAYDTVPANEPERQ